MSFAISGPCSHETHNFSRCSVFCRARVPAERWSIRRRCAATAGRKPVDHLFGKRQRAAPQSVDADHAGQRRKAYRSVDVSDWRSGPARSDTARRRRHHYLTGPDNHAWALDARTGRQIWHYRRQLPEGLNVCCGRVNRGFAIRGDRLYMTTLDAHLVALDSRTGNVLFDVEIDDHTKSYTATVAPLIVKDKVIVGIAGAEYGIRGFIDAFDASTGQKAWRFWTVPEPDQPGSNTWSGDAWRRGGGSTWVTGAFDPTLNLLYWGTGNPSPDSFGDARPGDNLYTDSVVALDVDTGTLRWHYQFTPHDVHDWDAVQVPILADLTINGAPRKVLMTANRNGFFYTLDRTNGALLRARPLSVRRGPRRSAVTANRFCWRPTALARKGPSRARTWVAGPTGCHPRSIQPLGCSTLRHAKCVRTSTPFPSSSFRGTCTGAAPSRPLQASRVTAPFVRSTRYQDSYAGSSSTRSPHSAAR